MFLEKRTTLNLIEEINGMSLMDRWLSKRGRTESTKKMNKHFMNKFLEWSNLTLEDLAKCDAPTAEQIILKYQKYLQDNNVCANTIRSSLSPLKTFFKFCRTPIDLKNNTVRLTNKREYHNFKSEDLKKLFNSGRTKDKALIATLCSSGQSIGDVVSLKRDFIEEQLNNDEEFVFFDTQRIKTNSQGLFALNPLSIEWLRKYLSERTDDDPRVFPLTPQGAQKILKRLQRESGFKSSRRLRLHKIRSWFISTCISAGLATEEWKILTSKSIKASDSTYIHIGEQLKEKYKKIFKSHLDFLGQSQTKTVEQLQQQVKALTNLLREKPSKTVTEEPELTELDKLREERKALEEQVNRQQEVVDKILEELKKRNIKIKF